MRTQLIFSLLTSITLINTLSLPTLAQTNNFVDSTITENNNGQIIDASKSPKVNLDNQEDIEISQDTAIIVSFPAPVTIDVGQKKPYPLTLPLASAIKDSQGNIVAPENTPVMVLLKPQNKGAKIVAQSLIINGKIVEIKASSAVIPGTKITHKRANDKAIENGAVWGKIGGSTFGFLGKGDPEKFDRGAMLGSAVGLISGLRTPENIRVVQISQSSVYILSLEQSIRISR